jgi:hypothetical protein
VPMWRVSVSPAVALISGCGIVVLAVVLLALGWIGWVAFAVGIIYAVYVLRIPWNAFMRGDFPRRVAR